MGKKKTVKERKGSKMVNSFLSIRSRLFMQKASDAREQRGLSLHGGISNSKFNVNNNGIHKKISNGSNN